jgi:hypothetical protein
VGISWPTSARKLAVPIPATPGPSQRSLVGVVGLVMAVSLTRGDVAARHSCGAMSGDLERIITTAVVISGPWVVGCCIWPLRGGSSDRGRRAS